MKEHPQVHFATCSEVARCAGVKAPKLQPIRDSNGLVSAA